MIFLVLARKMIFLFPENIILLFRRKVKDDLCQKKQKTWKYDIFFKCSEKMVFPKRSHWNMIFFVVLFGKMIFIFPENMILLFRRKMKGDLSQKKCMEIRYFLQMHRKDGLTKKNRSGIWSFLYYLERWYFFPENVTFFFAREMKDDLSQEIHGNIIFSVYICKCYKYDITLVQKN